MDRDIESMIKDCPACAASRSLNNNTPLQPVQLPKAPWLKGAVDIVGPIDNVYLARSKSDSNSKLKSKFDNIKYVIIDFVGRDTRKVVKHKIYEFCLLLNFILLYQLIS